MNLKASSLQFTVTIPHARYDAHENLFYEEHILHYSTLFLLANASWLTVVAKVIHSLFDKETPQCFPLFRRNLN